MMLLQNTKTLQDSYQYSKRYLQNLYTNNSTLSKTKKKKEKKEKMGYRAAENNTRKNQMSLGR